MARPMNIGERLGAVMMGLGQQYPGYKLGQQEMAYRKERDTVGDNQWQQGFDYRKGRDLVGDNQWQTQFNEGTRRFGLGYDLDLNRFNEGIRQFDTRMNQDESQFARRLGQDQSQFDVTNARLSDAAKAKAAGGSNVTNMLGRADWLGMQGGYQVPNKDGVMVPGSIRTRQDLNSAVQGLGGLPGYPGWSVFGRPAVGGQLRQIQQGIIGATDTQDYNPMDYEPAVDSMPQQEPMPSQQDVGRLAPPFQGVQQKWEHNPNWRPSSDPYEKWDVTGGVRRMNQRAYQQNPQGQYVPDLRFTNDVSVDSTAIKQAALEELRKRGIIQ